MDNPVHDIINICMVSLLIRLYQNSKHASGDIFSFAPQQPGPWSRQYKISHSAYPCLSPCSTAPAPTYAGYPVPVHIMKYKAFGEILIFHSFSSSVRNIPTAKLYFLSYHCMKGALSVFMNFPTAVKKSLLFYPSQAVQLPLCPWARIRTFSYTP